MVSDPVEVSSDVPRLMPTGTESIEDKELTVRSPFGMTNAFAVIMILRRKTSPPKQGSSGCANLNPAFLSLVTFSADPND